MFRIVKPEDSIEILVAAEYTRFVHDLAERLQRERGYTRLQAYMFKIEADLFCNWLALKADVIKRK